MEKERRVYTAHVLVLPFPVQGHINPLLQLSKRLVSKGIKTTFAITNFVSKSMKAEPSSVAIDTISDGYDEGGFESAESIKAYLSSLQFVGSQTLAQLIKKLNNSGCPVGCLIYDSLFPWALDVAKDLGLMAATFFTQSCTVNSIFYHVKRGLLPVPIPNPTVSLPGLPVLELQDTPSFFYAIGSYPDYFDLVLNQFLNLEKADWILVNTFHLLEHEVVDWMAKLWRLRAIGPSVPSVYLDKRVENDKEYGISLFMASNSTCVDWLNTRPIGSVIYVSFGSMSILGMDQMEELAWGLKGSNGYFLWVVRASEKDKVPDRFVEETAEKGLVVPWCSQLEVLAHKAVGCFVTHCGWNSTLEALSLGVPMVAIPQWTDQPTNAKYVEDVWGVGVRVRADQKGIVRREELQRCIREVMEGERGKEIKKNAIKWKNMAKEAVDEGGSSDKAIDEFLAELTSS